MFFFIFWLILRVSLQWKIALLCNSHIFIRIYAIQKFTSISKSQLRNQKLNGIAFTELNCFYFWLFLIKKTDYFFGQMFLPFPSLHYLFNCCLLELKRTWLQAKLNSCWLCCYWFFIAEEKSGCLYNLNKQPGSSFEVAWS